MIINLTINVKQIPMKKTLFAIIALFALQTTAMANKNSYYVQQINTKPWGVNWKNETAEPNAVGGMNYKLRCEGDGDKVCQFKDGTCPYVISTTLMNIQQNIYFGGALTGSGFTPWGEFSWDAIDMYNMEYEVIENF